MVKNTYASVMDKMSKKLATYEARLAAAQQQGDPVGIQDYGRRISKINKGMEMLFNSQEQSKAPQQPNPQMGAQMPPQMGPQMGPQMAYGGNTMMFNNKGIPSYAEGTAATPAAPAAFSMTDIQKELINTLSSEYNISPAIAGAVTAATQKESGGSGTKVENSYANTSATRIRNINGRFKKALAGKTDAEIDVLKKDPKAFFNLVYKNATGNDADGDGYKYRGRGLIQLTGKKNYADLSQAVFGDDRLVKNPDLLLDDSVAAKGAAWFITSRGKGLEGYLDFDLDTPNPTPEQIQQVLNGTYAVVASGGTLPKSEVTSEKMAERYGQYNNAMPIMQQFANQAIPIAAQISSYAADSTNAELPPINTELPELTSNIATADTTRTDSTNMGQGPIQQPLNTTPLTPLGASVPPPSQPPAQALQQPSAQRPQVTRSADEQLINTPDEMLSEQGRIDKQGLLSSLQRNIPQSLPQQQSQQTQGNQQTSNQPTEEPPSRPVDEFGRPTTTGGFRNAYGIREDFNAAIENAQEVLGFNPSTPSEEVAPEQSQQPQTASAPRTLPADGSYPGAAVNENGEYMLMQDPNTGGEMVITPDMLESIQSGGFGQALGSGQYNDQMIYFDPSVYQGGPSSQAPTTQTASLREIENPATWDINFFPEENADEIEENPANWDINFFPEENADEAESMIVNYSDSTMAGLPLEQAAIASEELTNIEPTEDPTGNTAGVTGTLVDEDGNGISDFIQKPSEDTNLKDDLGVTTETEPQFNDFLKSFAGSPDKLAQYGQFAPDVFSAYQMSRMQGPTDMPSVSTARMNTDINVNPQIAQAQDKLAASEAGLDANVSNPIVRAALKRAGRNQLAEYEGATRADELNTEMGLENQYAQNITNTANQNEKIGAANVQRNIDFENDRKAAYARMAQEAGQKASQMYGENRNRELDLKRLGLSSLQYDPAMQKRMMGNYQNIAEMFGLK